MILVQSRSIEDPRNSIADYWEDSGMIADTGQRITRKEALKYSPVWRAVKLVAEAVGRIPCRVYRRIDEGKERAKSHPAYNLLRWQPNREQTAFYFFSTLLGQCLLDPGNSYCYIDRTPGYVRELIPLDPHAVTVVRENGKLYYIYTGTNTPSRLEASEVLHFRGPGYDGLCGYSVLEFARNSIAYGHGAQKYSNKFFANNAEARVVLETPNAVKPERVKQLVEQWDKMHRGLDNAHRTAILTDGMKASQISISARDAQLIEALKWSVVDVSNWFGVPPHKLGDSSRTAYNSLEQENQAFLDDTLDPWLVMIEQECRIKLLSEKEKGDDSHAIEFDRSALIQANLAARSAYYRQALAGYPWMTVDEVRNLERLNGVGLDSVIAPTNNFGPAAPPPDGEASARTLIPAVTPPQEPNPPDARLAKVEQAARQAVKDIEKRMVKRIEYNYGQAARKSGKAGLDEVFAGICEKHDPVVREALQPAAETLALMLDCTSESVVDEAIQRIHAKARENER